MSPRPAAPSRASISACAITSPSEWPARPRSEVDRDAAEHERHAVLERVCVDAEADAQLRHASASGSSASESIADVCLLAAASGGSPTGRGGCARRPSRRREPARRRCRRGRRRRRSRRRRTPASATTRSKNSGSGLRDAPAGRRADAVHVDVGLAQELLARLRLVAGDADAVAARAQLDEAGQRVGVEVVAPVARPLGRLDAEQLEDLAVLLAAREHAAERRRRT